MRSYYFVLLAAVILATAVRADEACVNDCIDQRNYCDSQCGDYWCYELCEQQYNACYDSCQYCPTTRDYTVITPISRTDQQVTSCIIHNTSFLYLEQDNIKVYRETTQCNGSKSTQLLQNYNTSPYYCWATNHASCSPSVFSPYPWCPQ